MAMKTMMATKAAAPPKRAAVKPRAMKAAKAAAPPKSTKAAAKAAAKAAQKEREAAKAAEAAKGEGRRVCSQTTIRPTPDTTSRPPEDAVWWFADTRGVKSVWAVAWVYKGKIQQVMYTED